ncbi:Asp-tRNA(Asn)/Glu-tRNA(Gln) amidotransferase subunit GatB [Marinoscillum pacificum]|uniref:Asp-tRNA(Asn)/Glu-tRNA(Gln) amidotransferase subunit GatB n=1 Tax=Marinoscillum pacificum TaxID=392723 RepID=UPI002157A1DD|nr:Asp-tRNA(Asn)/Glu-tRNA(Gln) amidotransferase subunit GatB [Marinoscillum pacificum]
MISPEVKEKYQLVVGLEVHAQLHTESKIFSGDSNSFGDAPNTNVSVISLGHPGVMPKLNKKAVEYAIRMGLACDCKISEYQFFDRKNYFYPDLPKGYQVTQDKTPICVGGKVPVYYGDNIHSEVILNRIHLEEDAGKSIHVEGKKNSLIDLNRAGVPLIEIVTEPVIHSAEEAGAFLAEVRRIVRYLGICDGNMEEGSLRCDANVSVKLKDAKELGKKVELKNMNSIKSVIRAIEHETERQIDLIEDGEEILSETRTFDINTGRSSGMRTKEELNDYRYFPEPDLSPIHVTDAWLHEIADTQPTLPSEFRRKFQEDYGLSLYDAEVLTDKKEMAYFFDSFCEKTANYKAAANWTMGPIKSYLNEHGKEIDELEIGVVRLAEIIQLVDDNLVSFSAASQQLLPYLFEHPHVPAKDAAKSLNIIQESDSGSIQPIIDQVIEENPDKVKAYRNGKKGLIGMFMGEVMKKTQGKVDPKVAKKLLQDSLEL